jgi:ribose/xylose/arabinose/galactoside ABC-type transport system permease subunit/ABC-type sugar transport system substrate-binding protein
MPSYRHSQGGDQVLINRRTCAGLVAAAAVSPVFAGQERTRTIALLFDSLVSPFWVAAIERLRQQIRRRGWSYLEAISNLDDNRQYQQVQSMIQRGVDGIVIVHTDDKAVIPAIRAANAAGVPMVHFNRPPAPSDAYSVAVVADNRKLMSDTVTALLNMARQQGGQYRAAFLLGDLGDQNAVHRRDGFQDSVAHHTDIVTVVARIATDWNADKAFTGLSNALQAHPEINLFVTSSDFLTPQIAQALRIANKWHPVGNSGHVLIAGFDGDDNGYAQLSQGYYDVDGVQDLDYEVDLTLRVLTQIWAGERPPKTLVDPGFVITRDSLTVQRHRMWGYRAWQSRMPIKPSVALSPSQGSTAFPNSSGAILQPTTPVVGAAKWLLSLAVLGAVAHAMFSVKTLHDVLLAMLPLAILAAGEMLVLLIGQVDLSMTAVMAVGAVLSASVMTHPMVGIAEPIVTLAGVVTCVATGAIIGFFNGVCITLLRIPSFIVTLSVMMAGSGAAVWYASIVSDTVSIGGLPAGFRFIGYGTTAGIPVALTLCAGVLLAIHYLLSCTMAGRWLYAIGHNAEAARISGVPVQGATIAAFTASGLCAGIGAVIYTSRIEAGLPTLGQNMLLDIVAAAVIGGVSLFGGRGTVRMVLVGTAFLCILDKSLQLLGLSLFIVLAVKGCAILLAAVLDGFRFHRARAPA